MTDLVRMTENSVTLDSQDSQTINGVVIERRKYCLAEMEFSLTPYFPGAVCSCPVLSNNGGAYFTWLMVSKFHKRISSYAI